MGAPPLPATEIRRRIEAIEQCLREGYAPVGVYGGKGSAAEEACRRLGLNSGTLARGLASGRIKPDWSLYQAAPETAPGAPKERWRHRADGTLERVEAAPEPATEALSDRERVGYEDRIRALQQQIRTMHREELSAARIREQIYHLADTTAQPPDWTVEESVGGSAPGVPMTIWSDWHWGEVIRPDEVAGVNEFSTDIAKARLRLLVERTIDLCFNHMVRPEYPGIVICLGGDMITGEIHQELAESNDQKTLPALFDLQCEMERAIEVMADRFGRVFLPCVVGNHGRNTLKPRMKGRVHTSYEWHLYCQLERRFAGDPRIQFQIPGETDAHFRVHGHRYLLTHGDSMGVKGGDGIIGSLGPITRGRIKVHTSEAQIGRDFDTLLIGHWHQYLPLPGLIVNGALKGYDEFARLALRARYQPPIQALWFNHPRHGVTFQVPIYLDEARTAAAADWISWPAAA